MQIHAEEATLKAESSKVDLSIRSDDAHYLSDQIVKLLAELLSELIQRSHRDWLSSEITMKFPLFMFSLVGCEGGS